MRYAGYIGRVGALAVAMGVGVAVATTPGVAVAQPADSVSSVGDSPTAPTMSADNTPGGDIGADDAETPTEPGLLPEPTVDEEVVVDDGSEETPNADDLTDDDGDDDLQLAGSDADAAPTDDAEEEQDDTPLDKAGDGDSAYRTLVSELPDLHDESPLTQSDTDTAVVTEDDGGQSPADSTIQLYSAADDTGDSLPTAATDTPDAAPVPARWLIGDGVFGNVVNVASDLMSTVVSQLFGAAPAPTQSSLLWALLAFTRREFESLLTTGSAAAAAANQSEDENVLYLTKEEAAALLASDYANQSDTHVLVFGVDGLVMSKVLADDYNQAFFDLMMDGTTSASTLVGHETVSNPSWTGIETGVYSETTGVINNVFSYWTYNKYPTVYNQLERLEPTLNEEIRTVAIMDGSINEPIANAQSNGTPGADLVVHYDLADTGQGDLADWLKTDQEVGARVVQELQTPTDGVTPNFIFTSMAGPDNMGHGFGAGSPEYAAAVRNVNDQLGNIMDAVAVRENAGEEWTVIMVTDHGELEPYTYGIGHGFQSPQETTIQMIARGLNGGVDQFGDPTYFTPGAINNSYRNVDTTPTVVQLFGGVPMPYSDGVPLINRAANEYLPATPGEDALKLALTDAIAMYGYPDLETQIKLDTRTLTATVPYLVWSTTNTITAALPGSLTPVIRAIAIPIYQAVNIPAQIIARWSGVTGNSIIPPEWNPWVTSGTAQAAATFDIAACGADGLAALACAS